MDGLLHLILVPFGYALELGFIALAGWIFWRTRRKLSGAPSQDERLLRVMLAVGLIFPTFFYAAVRMNDLGFRVPMIAQFVLLLWSTWWIQAVRAKCIAPPSLRMKRVLNWRSSMTGSIRRLSCWHRDERMPTPSDGLPRTKRTQRIVQAVGEAVIP